RRPAARTACGTRARSWATGCPHAGARRSGGAFRDSRAGLRECRGDRVERRRLLTAAALLLLEIPAREARRAIVEAAAELRRAIERRRRTGHVDHHDAVDRAGRDAQLAAVALRRDHRVHEIRRADDRVHRARLDALGAADAIFLDDAR